MIAAQQGSPYLVFTPAQLQTSFTPGRTYIFLLSVTNRFGQSSFTQWPVFIAEYATPSVTIVPSEIIINSYDSVKLLGVGIVPPAACSGLFDDELVYTWSRASGPIFEFDVNTANTPSLYMPPFTFAENSVYDLELRVSYKSSPQIFGVANAYVGVKPATVVADISGGDRLFTLGLRALELDASSSYDTSDASLSFSWTCTMLFPERPCFATSDLSQVTLNAPVAVIPSTLLTIGEYRFDVVVSNVSSLFKASFLICKGTWN